VSLTLRSSDVKRRNIKLVGVKRREKDTADKGKKVFFSLYPTPDSLPLQREEDQRKRRGLRQQDDGMWNISHAARDGRNENSGGGRGGGGRREGGGGYLLAASFSKLYKACSSLLHLHLSLPPRFHLPYGFITLSTSRIYIKKLKQTGKKGRGA